MKGSFFKKSLYLPLQGIDIGTDLELVEMRREREFAVVALLATKRDVEIEEHTNTHSKPP